jgi:hypothetical protein
MRMQMPKQRIGVFLSLSLLFVIYVDALRVDIVRYKSIQVTIDEHALLTEAQRYHDTVGMNCTRVQCCTRILYIADKKDDGCIAAQFITCPTGSVELGSYDEEWLWFDKNGKFFPDADVYDIELPRGESGRYESIMIPPNPLVHSDYDYQLDGKSSNKQKNVPVEHK